MEEAKDKLIRLKDIADVRRGITTGINHFFYLVATGRRASKRGYIHCKNQRNWDGEIEEKYLRPVVKSPKEPSGISIQKNELKNFIFICNKSKKELKVDKDEGALAYINWGEKQYTRGNMRWSEVPSVKGRKYWWGIEVKEFADMLWPKTFNERFTIFKNDQYLSADRLYEITFKNEKHKAIVPILLNSTLQYFFIETNSRVNLGDGALDNMTYEAANCWIVNPDCIDIEKLNIEDKFLERKTKAIKNEVRHKDRKNLDQTILDAFGFPLSIYRSGIYQDLQQMVKERLAMPKLRQKRKIEKIRIAYDQIKASVIEDCIGRKAKQHPEDFYNARIMETPYEHLKFDTYFLNGKGYLKRKDFLGQYMLLEGSETLVVTDNKWLADFLFLFVGPNTLELQVPVDKKMIERIVRNYQTYIKTLAESLELNAHQKLHSWQAAKSMMKEIMAEYGYDRMS